MACTLCESRFWPLHAVMVTAAFLMVGAVVFGVI